MSFLKKSEKWPALSYIHVVIPINISGLLRAVDNFRAKVVVLKSNYIDHKKFANCLDYFGGWSANNHTKHALLHFRQQLSGLMDLMITDADNLQSGITSLRNSLPQVVETPLGPLKRTISEKNVMRPSPSSAESLAP